ncbi:ABC transporter permease [Telmatospirillum sp.]|uniref:ABC transporter permease n=1 Tax=Telmatospirillum sp. TaxID=2079197 RepID=UPI00284135FF|nr:ABC transporter permease [Telmatospirillum sp.]MDR3435000.1 ABC transporter permease [Telmatospirillum sp.]
MQVKVEPRSETSRAVVYATPVLAVLLTVISGYFLFLFLGLAPAKTLYHFLISPTLTFYGWSELCVKAGPLVLIATGLAVGFRANVWNIGAEGQLTLGAIGAGGVALAFWDQSGVWILPLMCFAGVLGGMIYGAIPAYLKTRFEVSEILTSLMLTYVATLGLGILVYGPWRDPQGFNFPQTRMFTDSALLPLVLDGTRMHVGILVTLAAAVAAWVLMTRAVIGFQVKVVGQAPAAARFAGFSRNRTIWLSFMISGGTAGLAGTFEAAGPVGQLVPHLTPGYGFTAIIVAFLGRLHPLGIIAAGFLMAISYNGGEIAQVEDRLPQAATGVFQGMLLFYLLACDFLSRYRIRLASSRREVGPS